MGDTQAKIERQGRCLCGAVTITAKTAGHGVGSCHCAMCRRWGSGPFMDVDCGQDVRIEGEENITRYQSSDWAERAFCRKCGTNLFYRLKEADHHIVSVGLFEPEDEMALKLEVFIDEKPDFYSFAGDAQKLTGAELFAMMQGQD
ncbi:GFA family protein [Parasphingopyxis algicola]|uniref:GFA family protein n=1 Tax=Parasphingopyxis algicola TaxID=2026624 RepID=UPI0015A16D74|nr:GFA family protein [Parasphingopyxis algicola]QLC25728.1 GFA family protein [Parasphingopyxis algicola]